MMKDKVWEVEHEGHKIKAINKISYFPPKIKSSFSDRWKYYKARKG